MNILEDNNKQFPLAIILDKKDASALVEIVAAALAGKKLNPRSNAAKLATKIDDELPAFR